MIIVTGGTGLIGSHLLLQLAKKGHDIRALKRTTGSIEALRKTFSRDTDNAGVLLNRITWYEADMLNKRSLNDAFRDVSQVYHCAGVVSFDPADHVRIMESNIQGTKNIVDLCLENHIGKLCHVSSVAALGHKNDSSEEFMDENTPWEDSGEMSAYSKSKYLSEQEVWEGIEKGLNAVIVNPSIVIGPGDRDRSSTRLINTVWKGLRLYTTGSGSFVDVRDVCRAMIELMESDISGERFVITSENLKYQELFNMIADNLSKKRPGIKVTKLMGEVAWRINKMYSIISGKPPVITRDIVRSGQAGDYYSNEKIRKSLNFEFIPIEQSVSDTCKIFLKEYGD